MPIKSYAPELTEFHVVAPRLVRGAYKLCYSTGDYVIDGELEFKVIQGGSAEVSFKLIDCKADSLESALSKMAEWLEGMATTLQNRPTLSSTIPIY